MNRASIKGEMGGVSVGVFEKAEQIVGEFGGHVVHVNPNGKGHRVVWIQVQPIYLGVKNDIIELRNVVLSVMLYRL